MYSSVAFVCLLMPHIITSNPTYLWPPGFPFHNSPAPQPFPPGFPYHRVPGFPFNNYNPFAYWPYLLPGQSSTTPEQENNGTMEEKAEGRKANPLNINGGVGTVGTINNNEGRKADPLNIKPLDLLTIGCHYCVNFNEGRKADPLNINGGVGTVGTINNNEGRKLELLPCPYSVGHPLQFWCNYEPFTWSKFPPGFPFHKYPFHKYPLPAGFPFHKYTFPPRFPFNY